MNANIVKMQIFHKIKYDLIGHSRSQIMTFLIKNSPFLLFMLLIDWRNKCRWKLGKNKVWLIQRRHLPCFGLNLRSYGQLFVLVFILLSPQEKRRKEWRNIKRYLLYNKRKWEREKESERDRGRKGERERKRVREIEREREKSEREK